MRLAEGAAACKQSEDEANSAGDSSGSEAEAQTPVALLNGLAGAGRMERDDGGKRMASRGMRGVWTDREQHSPSCAPLQEPALPYTSGAFLGDATATLLLLLPSVRETSSGRAGPGRGRRGCVGALGCSSVACAISRARCQMGDGRPRGARWGA